MLCSSGNLSWRIGEEALISGTGSWVPTLAKEKVSICNIASGTPTNGVKPSMESTFHLGVLRETAGCKCSTPFPVGICHCHLLHEKQTDKFQRNGRNTLSCRVGNSRNSLLSAGISRIGQSGSRSNAEA